MIKSKKIPFTEQENLIIQNSVKLIGEDWHEISKKLPGRTPKQIHDRYINYLRDGLKTGPWTNQEDEILIKMYRIIGPKWTKMMENLPGRSGNDIKNRWHKHLCKRPFLHNEMVHNNPNYNSNIINNSNENHNNNNNNNHFSEPIIYELNPQSFIQLQPKTITINEPIMIDPNKNFAIETYPHFYGLIELVPNLSSMLPKRNIEIHEFLEDLSSHNLEFSWI